MKTMSKEYHPMIQAHPCIPESKLKLLSNEVHLWHASVSRYQCHHEKLINVLSKSERQRADRFRFEQDRFRFIVAHGFLRYLLSCYGDSDPSQHQFQYNRYRKPALAGNPSLHFNLSHSGDQMFFGLTLDHRIGVDIEQIQAIQDFEQIVTHQFSSREQAEFSNIPNDLKNKAFLTCWTRKEAYIKAQGMGLSLPLHQFSVSFLPNERPCLTETQDNINEKNHWEIREVIIHDDYIAAVAVEGNDLLFRNSCCA